MGPAEGSGPRKDVRAHLAAAGASSFILFVVASSLSPAGSRAMAGPISGYFPGAGAGCDIVLQLIDVHQ